MNPRRVSVIGLGKLGLPLAAFFASRGCKVVGVDANQSLLNELRKSTVRSTEPGLRETFSANCEHFYATDCVSEAIDASETTFIIVPTPSLPSGEFSTEFVQESARDIGNALKSKPRYHLVVLVSTVLPGATRKNVLHVLESHSGKSCGKDFGVCYNPEFIALGTVLNDLTNPDFVLIGESDPVAGNLLQSLYTDTMSMTAPVSRMSLENAELAKLSVNAFVTTKISYANMLAEICEHMPGLDIATVARAIGQDSRIGIKYLNGGLGYGGPCFPRDSKALVAFAKRIGAGALLAESTDRVNCTQAKRLVERLLPTCNHSTRVSVLGLSYKKDTPVIEESQAMEIISRLKDSVRLRVTVFDKPAALEAARRVFGDKVVYAPSLVDAVTEADIVILPVADRGFVPEPTTLKKNGNGVIIVDPWRIADRNLFEHFGARYCTVGTI